MTGGTVAILGPAGYNLAAGMTGGVLFVWDPAGEAPRRFAVTSPQAAHPSPADLDELHTLLREHLTATASPTAAALLDDWDRSRRQFWAMRPSPA
jgi:glutamate synthase domain-containing protein 3